MSTKQEVWFEQNQEKLVQVLKHAIEKAMIDMGDDIKCIEWFCSRAAENIAKRQQQ